MKQALVYLGMDVAKAHLDASFAGASRRFANNKTGCGVLLKWIKTLGPVQIVCEASGGYEQTLLEVLWQSQIPVSLVQASRVRQYARAAGILAKSDQIDARVLSGFGAALRPEPTRAPSPQQRQLRELDHQRHHLSGLLVAEQNRLAQLRDRPLLAFTRSLIRRLEKQIATIDGRMASLIAQDQQLALKAQKLTAIKGVGQRTAALLLAQMPELGTLNRREAAALAGLAPFNRDSGSIQAKRTIFGGRRALRSGLYMAALSAARCNPILSVFYRRLRAKNKPHKVALTAVMRKLLLALNQSLSPTSSFA
jgi:transposase